MLSFSSLFRRILYKSKELEKEEIKRLIEERLKNKKPSFSLELDKTKVEIIPEPKEEEKKDILKKEKKPIEEQKKEEKDENKEKKEEDPIEELNKIEEELKKEANIERGDFFFFYDAPNSGDVNLSSNDQKPEGFSDLGFTNLLEDLLSSLFTGQTQLNLNPQQMITPIYAEKNYITSPETIVVPDFDELMEEETELEKELDKLKLPKFKKKKKTSGFDPTKIWDTYDLITWEYNKEKFVMAKCLIRWDDRINALKYFVIEEKLNKQEQETLEKVANYVKHKIDLEKIGEHWKDLVKYAVDLFNKILEQFYGKKFDNYSKAKISYYFYRNYLGLERVEPFMHDQFIEDISCDGVNIPIFVFHSKPLYGSLETNVKFESKEELDRFIYRLAQLSGRSISIAKPLLDGILPDGSRVQATLGSDVARKGSNFTIRKFRQRILTPVDLMYYGTADENIFVYLWFLIETYKSILIAGPTASGKTTFLNAISLFIKPESKIVTIEDTAELRLPHPNWIPLIERRVVGRDKYTEVTMYDLLKAALRQRPDYIIVGEVRGQEANVLFHAMETGHGALGTIHAEDLDSLIDRLTSPPINIPLPRIQALDAVVFLARKVIGRSIKRRVLEITEIVGYNRSTQNLETNKAFVWDVTKDEFIPQASVLLEKIRKFKGLTKRGFKREYARRLKLMKWLKENKVTDYKEMFNYIREYYFNPDYVDQLKLKEEIEVE